MVIWLVLLARLIVSVDSEKAAENAELSGTISVHCGESAQIAPSTFELEGEPLETLFLRDAQQSSMSLVGGVRSEERSVIATYQFAISGHSAGRHILPPISVEIDGERVASAPTSFFVFGSEATPDYQLHAYAEEELLYPGQRTRLINRIAFRYPIEGTLEELPLLEGRGFRKVGSQTVRTDFEGGMTIREVAQEVEALTPGTFEFEKSLVEGFPYRRDFFGRSTFEPRKLRAEAPSLSLKVLPFPEEGRPANFTGALGTYSVEASLASSDEVAVGDRIRLQITLKGEGSPSTLRLPDLRLGEHFRLSDLPPEVVDIPGGKRFTVELRPLSTEAVTIPPIAFSSFDPKTKHYKRISSLSIPLTVSPLADGRLVLPPPTRKVEEVQLHKVSGVLPLGEDALRSPSKLWGFWIFPLAALILFFRRFISIRREVSPLGAIESVSPDRALSLLEQALAGEPRAKHFLSRVAEVRYSGKEMELAPLIVEGKKLLEGR